MVSILCATSPFVFDCHIQACEFKRRLSGLDFSSYKVIGSEIDPCVLDRVHSFRCVHFDSLSEIFSWSVHAGSLKFGLYAELT